MRFVTDAVAPEAFARWVVRARGGGLTLDEAADRVLAHRDTVPRAVAFAHVAPRLFDRIVAQHAPPTDKPPVAPNVGEAEAMGKH